MNTRPRLFLKSWLLIFLLVTILGHVSAQDKGRKELEKEKQEYLQNLKKNKEILGETQSRKKASIGQLNAIREQIRQREKLIRSIEDELKLINKDIEKTENKIKASKNDLRQLKDEYASMIYAASKSNSAYDKLTFLFAAKTFNEFVMRMEYFEQYAEARKKQAEAIKETRSKLQEHKEELYDKKAEQETLLKEKKKENKKQNKLIEQKLALVKELENEEDELRQKIEDQKEAVEKLEKLIKDLINRDIKKTAENTPTPEVEMLSKSFKGNKNRLIWPVKHGFISQKFGKAAHPVFDVEVENLGVDIQTLENANVRAVFDGKVVTVAKVPGMNNVVMLKHGSYYTFYAKLSKVTVRSGQQVKARDKLGEVFTDEDGVSVMKFQVWQNNKKLNPEDWLYVR